MISPVCASVMAWRSEPRPLSAVLVTTIVRPGTGIGTDVGEEVGRGISVTVDVVDDALRVQPGTSRVSTTARNSRTTRFICSRSRSASTARRILVASPLAHLTQHTLIMRARTQLSSDGMDRSAPGPRRSDIWTLGAKRQPSGSPRHQASLEIDMPLHHQDRAAPHPHRSPEATCRPEETHRSTTATKGSGPPRSGNTGYFPDTDRSR